MPHRKLDVEEIAQRIDDYFTQCEEQCKVPLYPELLLYIPLCKDTWDKYLNYTPPIDNINNNINNNTSKGNKELQLSMIIKKAQLRLEAAVSREAMQSSRPTAAIFLLKQKPYGAYADRQDIAACDVPITVQLKNSKGEQIG